METMNDTNANLNPEGVNNEASVGQENVD